VGYYNKVVMEQGDPPQCLGIDWGKYNDMPTPWKRITRDEFDVLFHCNAYSIQWMDYKQTYNPEDKEKDWHAPVAATHIYMFGGRGVCLAVRESYINEEQARKLKADWIGNDKYYGYALQYYRIGCQHEHTEDRGRYMFDHLIHCKDCGWSGAMTRQAKEPKQ